MGVGLQKRSTNMGCYVKVLTPLTLRALYLSGLVVCVFRLANMMSLFLSARGLSRRDCVCGGGVCLVGGYAFWVGGTYDEKFVMRSL